jgi:GH18 family chitinase
MHGAFDYEVNGDSPVGLTYSQATWDTDPTLTNVNQGVSIKASLDKYLAYGVPFNKIVVGFPAYGRSSFIATAGNTGGVKQVITSADTPAGELDSGNASGAPNGGLFEYRCLMSSSACLSGGAAITNNLSLIQSNNAL